MADKLLCIPVWASCRPGSAPLPRPGLRGGYTRSQAVLQTVFDKRKACLDEKRSRFNRFRTCSRTVPVFIVQLIHSTLSFFTMMVMTDE